MNDVFTVLGKDHLEVKSMLTALQTGGADAGKIAERLVIEESRHEAAEEMHFWPAVRDRVPGGAALADMAIEQEAKGKDVLEDLRKAAAGDPYFIQLVATFTKAGSDHIAFEEEKVWPALRAALSPKEALELGKKIEAAKESGPTRPHPTGPDGATGLKTVGQAAAAMDKVRDKISGRG